MGDSFFGFDTSLPAAAPRGSSSLDAKLAALGEDIRIYDYGQLEEGADDFNDETFGGGDAEKNRDFDFVGSTARLGLGDGVAAPVKQPPVAAGSSLLDYDPLLGPVRRDVKPPMPTAPAGQRGGPAPKSLAEIEAEMRAQHQTRQSPRPPQPKTMAEVEAEMRNQRASQPPPMGFAGPAPPPSAFGPQQLPPHLLQRLPPNFHMFPPQQQQAMMAQLHQIAFAEHQRAMQQQHQPLGPLHAAPQQQHERESLPQRSASPMQQQGARAPPQNALPAGSMFPPLASANQGMSPIPPAQTLPPPKPSELQRLKEQKEQVAKLGNEGLLKQLEQAIREQEAAEKKAIRITEKIEAMSHDNGIMSRSDKDFITRIQVSQLVNSAGPQGSHDPYHDDFYFHVYSAIRKSREQQQQSMSQKPGQQQRPTQQQAGALASKQAMKKMALAVQRLVDDSKKRPRADQLVLRGALGKITRGSAAPRPALAVKPEEMLGIHRKLGSLPVLESNNAAASSALPPAMDKRETLMTLERLYGMILDIEQLRRSSPQLASELDPSLKEVMAPVVPEDAQRFAELRQQLWTSLRVMDPLDGRDPHAFVSLITPVKGKRLIPRVLRQTDRQQSLTLLTLLVATFGQLDVVRLAPAMDDTLPASAPADRRKAQADANTSIEAFMSTIVPSVITILNGQPLRIVAGLLGLLIGRNDVLAVAQSRAGVAFMTILLSRAELLKQEASTKGESTDSQDFSSWTQTYNVLFARLSGHWLSLFPSTRASARLPLGQGQLLLNTRPDIDGEDQAVWQLLAAIAVSADMQQQQTLVGDVREKVLENVFAAKRKTVDPITGERKLRNVDLLLNALGLSSSQIQLDE